MNHYHLLLVLFLLSSGAQAQQPGVAFPKADTGDINEVTLDVQSTQVRDWNLFAQQLYSLHKLTVEKGKPARTMGGIYGGELWKSVKWTEQEFEHQGKYRTTSRIRRVDGEDAPFQTLDIVFRDNKDRIVRDYSVTFLPFMRNAPIQTLINLHNYNDTLHAWRQFDASNRRIYEQCQGTFFGDEIDIRLEDWEIPDHPGDFKDLVQREAYRACFDDLPVTATPYTNPLIELDENRPSGKTVTRVDMDTEAAETRITRLSLLLLNRPDDAQLFLRRGDLYLLVRDMEKAINDYTRAIELNDKLDGAYFGRGMAHGRAGNLEEAIADLTIFLDRNPRSSKGYTKRGVRYIWFGKLDLAERDLTQAVALDGTNSEAHDDLGVILARKKQFASAINHFRLALTHDPQYQKAYHNLALTYYLMEEYTSSLNEINQSLRLNPNSRNSLLLKGEILKAMGRVEDARNAADMAELLPKGNWSEEFGF